jgi:hypothetical protein
MSKPKYQFIPLPAPVRLTPSAYAIIDPSDPDLVVGTVRWDKLLNQWRACTTDAGNEETLHTLKPFAGTNEDQEIQAFVSSLYPLNDDSLKTLRQKSGHAWQRHTYSGCPKVTKNNS